MKEEALKRQRQIEAPQGKLGVLIPGLGGPLSTTFIAGVELVRRGLAEPVGSLTQLGAIRLGKRQEHRNPKVRDVVPLASIDDLAFGGWDIYDANAYDAAFHARVLRREYLEPVKDFLSGLRPMRAVFDRNFVRNLDGTYIKEEKSLRGRVEAIAEDIRRFKEENGVERCVVIWCGSTEVHQEPGAIHQSLEAFQKAVNANDPQIPPSMIYALAALESGVPFINGAPNLTIDVPAMVELAKANNVPIAGKDFKTGEMLMKTMLAPMLKNHLLGLEDWCSTSILGNRDGLVLDDEAALKASEESGLSVLESALQPQLHPSLYKNYYHRAMINYYPPRGDNRETWDSIDIFGWLGQPMQIKVNFQCRDCILAAPLVLDLALFADFAHRIGMGGIQDWLSFYFKSPMQKGSLCPEHDHSIQLLKLKNTLRCLMGEEQITHLDFDCDDLGCNMDEG